MKRNLPLCIPPRPIPPPKFDRQGSKMNRLSLNVIAFLFPLLLTVNSIPQGRGVSDCHRATDFLSECLGVTVPFSDTCTQETALHILSLDCGGALDFLGL